MGCNQSRGYGDSGHARRAALQRWFRVHRREFSWRSGSPAWETFLAEMLLRRTKADQVARLLPTVVATYPNPASMAEAELSDLESVLRPVGLLRRAAELQQCAVMIELDFDGSVPQEIDDLLTLPGVGPYVASSIAAVLSSARVNLVDTNTIRVALRVAGLEIRARDVRRQKAVGAAIEDLLGGPAPAADWWSVIDLAASVCRPREPRCRECPISPWCAEAASRLPRLAPNS